MSKPKVIVTRRWPEQVETRLAEVFDVRLNESDRPMSQDERVRATRRLRASRRGVSHCLGPHRR